MPGWTVWHDGPCAALGVFKECFASGEDENAAGGGLPTSAAAIPPVGGPDPLARSMALAMTIQKQVDHGKLLVVLTERLDKLTQILLDVAPDACARHDLVGF